jgi:predicted metalloendopeptidase
LIEHNASVLPKAVAAEDFTFYGTILTGTRQAPERSKAAIAATNGTYICRSTNRNEVA